QPVACILRVRNAGTEALGGVRVVLPLPPGAKLLGGSPQPETDQAGLAWSMGNLLPGTEQSLKLELASPDASELRLCPVASFSAAAGMRTAIVRPPLGIAALAPESATVGDKATVAIRVTNNTPNILRRVFLSCRLPAGLAHPQGQFIEAELPGEMHPGQACEEKLELSCAAAGNAQVRLAARADGGMAAEGGFALDIAEPMLALEVAGPRTGSVGQEMEYRLSLRNPGQAAVPASVLSLPLPEGVEFVEAGEGGRWDPKTGTASWAVPALRSQAKMSATVKVKGQKAGDWALAALASSDGTRAARRTAAVRIEHGPALTMDLSRIDDPLGIGQETTYEVRLCNAGPGPTPGVQVRMELPPQLLAVQGEGPTRWRIEGQQVVFDAVERMPARMDAMFRVRVRAVASGSGRCRATATAEGLPAPLSREATANVR
ncbi:MAG: DUF11 domain-containing protein, partial [Gemmataceae bacterium]|nr:DUF11 domain-containing protein [Gemmataceae bacterium]